MQKKTNPHRWTLALLMLFSSLLLLGAAPSQVLLQDFGDNGLTAYLEAAGNTDSYAMLIAMDLAQGGDISAPDHATLMRNAALLSNAEDEAGWLALLDDSLRWRVKQQLARLSYLRQVVDNKRFPLLPSVSYSYWNDWGQGRTFGGERTHEGCDIIADWGVPIYAVGPGVVEKIGWNTLGGWRIGVRGEDGVYYYYAHLSSYYDSMFVGAPVRKGQLLGFVGDTGYGPVGTSGVMVSHLHLGLYEGDPMVPINAYPLLRRWESQ